MYYLAAISLLVRRFNSHSLFAGLVLCHVFASSAGALFGAA